MSDELGDLLDDLDMEDWLSMEGVDYRHSHGRSGLQLQIKECPRCGGTDWKVYLNADNGLGNCFHGACQGEPGFNKYTFIQAHLDTNGRDTVAHIKDYSRSLGWQPKKVKAKVQQPTTLPTVSLPASVPMPTNDGQYLNYLKDRGISPTTSAHFQLKFAVDAWWNYEVAGERKGQKYENRLVIPVHDLEGTLVNFQGRDITGLSAQKYLFPPGLPGTACYLYNAHRARGRKVLIVNEGAFDVMATHQALATHRIAGIGVVGTFGKHLSGGDNPLNQVRQLRALKAEGLESVVMMWDGSRGAALEALKTCQELIGLGLKAYLALLPAGKDPNEATPAEVVDSVRTAFRVTSNTKLLVMKEINLRYRK